MLQTEKRENKMGIMPVPKLLLNMSVPMMISMMVMALYNIIDSIFVAQINENALTALSLAFPIQNFMIAIANGTGVGINSLLSRSLGEKNQKEVNASAVNGIFLALISSILFAVFGFLFAEPYMLSQTKDPEIIKYGTQYLQIISLFSIGVFMEITFERIIQSSGKTFYSMITQITGAIINIILDPIMIFGLFGFPKMGVTGAALATVIGEIGAAGLSLYFNLRKNHEVKISFKKFTPCWRTIKSIYTVGAPSFLMQSIGSVLTFCLNKILIQFTTTAVSVFGIYFKLQSFIFMPVFGLNNGMVPIIAYNYGARNKKRILDTMKYSIGAAVVVMFFGFIIFQIFPVQLLSLFNATDAMLEIGVPALRIISLHFVFAGFCIITVSVFQALGNGLFSLINSLTRQLILLLPAAYLLSKNFGLTAIWFAFPIAEIGSLLICIVFLKHIYNQKIKPLEN
ncbi:MAG: MATE family efflux transporter [Lachnospiraceae bacterium]|nr:MATE family efflux transporter [Lachnospiraceae bacterium]